MSEEENKALERSNLVRLQKLRPGFDYLETCAGGFLSEAPGYGQWALVVDSIV